MLRSNLYVQLGRTRVEQGSQLLLTHSIRHANITIYFPLLNHIGRLKLHGWIKGSEQKV